MHVGKDIEFADIGEVLKAARYAIQQNMDTLDEGVEDPLVVEEELKENMNIFLYLIVIFTKIKKSNSSCERFEAMKTIYQVGTTDIFSHTFGFYQRLFIVTHRLNLA